MSEAIPVAFFLHHLESGGLERVVVNLLRHLDRGRFRPLLVLQHRRGAMLARVPEDVPVHDLGGLRSLRAPRRLAALLEREGARVAYAGTRATNLALVRAAGRMTQPPAVVVSEHTTIASSLAEARRRPLYLAAMRWAYPRAARVVVPNALIGAELKQVLGRPDLPVTELPNPVYDPADLPSGERKPEPGLLVAVGRLIHAKGFDLLLEALAHVPGASLDLLGDGPERAALEAQATRLGLADRVRFAGDVPDPYPAMLRAQALVLSSRREGAGNVLIEAMALGVPVIATDCPSGPRVLLRDGVCGVLVPCGDPPALAQAIVRLLGGDDGIAVRVAAGRERAAGFAADRAARSYAELLVELAGAGDGRSPSLVP